MCSRSSRKQPGGMAKAKKDIFMVLPKTGSWWRRLSKARRSSIVQRFWRMGGRRVRVKAKGFIKPLALGGSKGFEFARGGEGVGKGGVKG